MRRSPSHPWHWSSSGTSSAWMGRVLPWRSLKAVRTFFLGWIQSSPAHMQNVDTSTGPFCKSMVPPPFCPWPWRCIKQPEAPLEYQ